MKENQPTKESLLKRRGEIMAQMQRAEKDLRIDLDRDLEDQAIQTENEDVSITMENNLRAELTAIEEKLAEMENNSAK